MIYKNRRIKDFDPYKTSDPIVFDTDELSKYEEFDWYSSGWYSMVFEQEAEDFIPDSDTFEIINGKSGQVKNMEYDDFYNWLEGIVEHSDGNVRIYQKRDDSLRIVVTDYDDKDIIKEYLATPSKEY